MADLLIPGAQQRWFPHGSQRFYAAGGNTPATLTKTNPKIILHTTEGTGWTNYDNGAKNPTFTVNPWARQVQQHMPLQYGSRALRGSVAINASGVQVEIVGCTVKAWAAKIKRPDLYVGLFGDDEYAYLAKVFAEVQRLTGIPNVTTVAWPLGAAAKGDETYGATKWRLSLSQWNAARGFVGHLHAPGNLHSDPGCLDVPRLIRAIEALGPTPKPTPTPTPKPVAKLTVDGLLGPLTIKALQTAYGTPVDGVISRPVSTLIKAVQTWLNKTDKAGLVVDGTLGPLTIKAWQRHYKTPVDGVISTPSALIKAVQTWLNNGGIL